MKTLFMCFYLRLFVSLGFGKGGLLGKRSFQKLPFLEVLENLQTVENKGESDDFLEIWIRDFLEICPS